MCCVVFRGSPSTSIPGLESLIHSVVIVKSDIQANHDFSNPPFSKLPATSNKKWFSLSLVERHNSTSKLPDYPFKIFGVSLAGSKNRD